MATNTNSKRPINEIPGISASAAVQLNRAGINTIADLLRAEYEQVAVLMDCFDDAARVIKEAKYMVESESKAPARTQSSRPSGGLSSSGGGGGESRSSSDATGGNSSHRAPHGGGSGSGSGSSKNAQRPVAATGELSSNGAALAAAFQLSVGEAEQHPDSSRDAMARRMGVASRLMVSTGSGQEPIAALLVEPLESGGISPEQLTKGFGPVIAKIADEVMAIRAVPMSPSGRLPSYYLEMASKASVSARRICAAFQVWWLEQPASQAPGASAWYGKLILEALENGEPDAMVAQLSERMRRSKAA